MEASEQLLDLAFLALDHAVESVSEGGSLVPFVVVETASGPDVDRFMAGTLEGSIEAARRSLRERSGVTRAALAYDGYITIQGTKYDCVYVEAHEAGDPSSIVLCQRYEPRKRFRSFRTIGDPGHAGSAEPLLAA